MTSLAPAQMTAAPTKRLWLITFVDLVMLLLAFFVLMFSMSTPDKGRFAAIASGYASAFHALGGVEETTVGPQRLPALERVPGDDLAYLETVLKSAFSRSPSLDGVGFRLTAQYLILELPTAVGGSQPGDAIQVLDATTQRQVFEIGGVLSNLPNRIAVLVQAPAKGDTATWSAARARAAAVRDALVASGYPKSFAVLARGADAAGEAAVVPPTRILVMPDTPTAAGEAP